MFVWLRDGDLFSKPHFFFRNLGAYAVYASFPSSSLSFPLSRTCTNLPGLGRRRRRRRRETEKEPGAEYFPPSPVKPLVCSHDPKARFRKYPPKKVNRRHHTTAGQRSRDQGLDVTANGQIIVISLGTGGEGRGYGGCKRVT